MRYLASAVLALMAMGAAPAYAQSGATPVGPSTGVSGGSGGPGSSTSNPEDLDLPMDPPKLQVPIQPGPPVDEDTPINEDGPPGDDPRDTPPPTFYGEEIDTETDTIYYVIDASCSMGWDVASYVGLDGNRHRGPRMDRAKAELVRSITGLASNFKFNIVSYDCSNQTWRRSMQDANSGNKSAARAWVMALQPGGATGTGPAVSVALRERGNKTVVLLTDGEPNCGAGGGGGRGGWDDWETPDDHRRMIRNNNSQGATINVFGIAASGQYRRFCQNVASDSGGSYFDVP